MPKKRGPLTKSIEQLLIRIISDQCHKNNISKEEIDQVDSYKKSVTDPIKKELISCFTREQMIGYVAVQAYNNRTMTADQERRIMQAADVIEMLSEEDKEKILSDKNKQAETVGLKYFSFKKPDILAFLLL